MKQDAVWIKYLLDKYSKLCQSAETDSNKCSFYPINELAILELLLHFMDDSVSLCLLWSPGFQNQYQLLQKQAFQTINCHFPHHALLSRLSTVKRQAWSCFKERMWEKKRAEESVDVACSLRMCRLCRYGMLASIMQHAAVILTPHCRVHSSNQDD